MWPGYGENCRVLDWILRRIDEEPGTARPTPVGNVPTQEAFNTEGLKVDYDGLFSVPIDFWTDEVSVDGRNDLLASRNRTRKHFYTCKKPPDLRLATSSPKSYTTIRKFL